MWGLQGRSMQGCRHVHVCVSYYIKNSNTRNDGDIKNNNIQNHRSNDNASNLGGPPTQ